MKKICVYHPTLLISKCVDEEQYETLSEQGYIRGFSELHRENISKSCRHLKKSEAHIQKMRATFARNREKMCAVLARNRELYRLKGVSEETKKKISITLKGKKRKPFSDETKMKMKISQTLRRNKERKLL